MTFANPRIYWLALVLMPALVWFLYWSWKKRIELIGQFVQSRLLAQLTVGVSPRRKILKSALLASSVMLLLITLSGPRAGFDWEEARHRGLDIVVAMDTSRSMLANDVSPSRLARAKLEVLDLLKIARNDRLGLVAFSGTAFLQCPLTLDEDAFRQSVASLDVGIIPQGGTAIAEAIRTALSAFKDEKDNHKILVLFTDGEDHEADAETAAKEAAAEGLKIFTIGVGTPEGELLRSKDEKGVSDYVKDESGNVVKSRLNERLLQQIATTASGFYLPLRGTKTMATLYEQGLAPLPKSDSSSKLLKKYHERYAWPLAIALLVLAVEALIPDRKRVRVTAAEVAQVTHPTLRGLVPILLVGLLGTGSVMGSSASAKKAFDKGNYREAADEYERLSKANPEDARLRFNAGTAALEAGDFGRAATNLNSSLNSQDLKLQQRAYYNLGNALFKAGEEVEDFDKKVESWKESIQRFESALKLDQKDPDAQHNLDFVRARLEELKNQQKQKKDDKKSDSKDQKDSENQDEKQGEENKDQQSKDKSGDKGKQKQDDSGKQDQQKQNQEKKPNDSKDSKDQQGAGKDQKDQKQDKQNSEGKDGRKDSKDDSKGKDQSGDKQKEGQESGARKGEPGGEGAKAGSAVMSQEQAMRILDSQRGEEKAMLFLPKGGKNSRSRIYKDW